MAEKIKRFWNFLVETEKGKDVLVFSIIVLVGLASFELGRLSKKATDEGGLKIEYPVQQAAAKNALDSLQALSTSANSQKSNSKGSFFASVRGKKYYPLGCSAGKNIKMENRVYFSSALEAQQAGYELSSSCR